MGSYHDTAKVRLELEARVLAAALKQSFERGDMSGARLAHLELTALLKSRIADDSAQGEKTKEQIIEQEPSNKTDKQPATNQQTKDKKGPPQLAETNKHNPKTNDQSGKEAVSSNQSELTAKEFTKGKSTNSDEQSVEAATINNDTTQASTKPSASKPSFLAGENTEQAVTFYSILNSNPVASFQSIHSQFLRMVKTLIKEQEKSSALSTKDFRQRLRLLCVAHDILKDPITRTDYDFRRLGLRGKSSLAKNSPTEEARQAMGTSKIQIRIGELLRCSEILEPSELDIAVDMHKAMPEMPFGLFLVKQGFLSEVELDSALLGQSLIQTGKITVAQFKLAMLAMREKKTSFSNNLLERGWIDTCDVTSWQKPMPESLKQAITEDPPLNSDSDTNNVISTHTNQINTHNALPDWAGQIVWDDNNIPECAVKPPPFLEESTIEGLDDLTQDPVVVSLHQQLSTAQRESEAQCLDESLNAGEKSSCQSLSSQITNENQSNKKAAPQKSDDD